MADTEDLVAIRLLGPADEAEMFDFEVRNREFFARTVGDRGDAFFGRFAARHRRLVEENADGTSMLFAVRDRQGGVVGRVNIGPIVEGSGDLGYRIAADACGRGFARSAVRQALDAARARGLSRVTAMTTVDNVASQRVLAATGFEPLPGGEPAALELGRRTHPAVHFERTLTHRH